MISNYSSTYDANDRHPGLRSVDSLTHIPVTDISLNCDVYGRKEYSGGNSTVHHPIPSQTDGQHLQQQLSPAIIQSQQGYYYTVNGNGGPYLDEYYGCPGGESQSTYAEANYCEEPYVYTTGNYPEINARAATSSAILTSVSNKSKACYVASWLRNNYEPEDGVSLPRSLLYSHYYEQCRLAGVESVNSASFGKIIRAVFPNLKTRRLGTRGHSKYHYYGIKYRGFDFARSSTNDLQQNGGDLELSESTDSVMEAQPHRSETFEDPHRKAFDPSTIKIDTSEEGFLSLLQEHIYSLSPFPECMGTFLTKYIMYTGSLMRRFKEDQYDQLQGLFVSFWNEEMKSEFRNQGSLIEEMSKAILLADDILYQGISQTVLKNTLEVVPEERIRGITMISDGIESWMNGTLETQFPYSIIDVKMEFCKRTSHLLHRRLAIYKLCHSLQGFLGDRAMLEQMYADWCSISFAHISEQVNWTLYCRPNIISLVEITFKDYLKLGVPLSHWILWVRTLIDQSLQLEDLSAEQIRLYESNSKQFLLKWSFLATLLMKDLTMRNVPSFSNWQLLRLLIEEYVTYVVEKKLDDIRRPFVLTMRKKSQWMEQSNSVYGSSLDIMSANNSQFDHAQSTISYYPGSPSFLLSNSTSNIFIIIPIDHDFD